MVLLLKRKRRRCGCVGVSRKGLLANEEFFRHDAHRCVAVSLRHLDNPLTHQEFLRGYLHDLSQVHSMCEFDELQSLHGKHPHKLGLIVQSHSEIFEHRIGCILCPPWMRPAMPDVP